LSRRQPQRLWFSHLWLHRVEALTTVTHINLPDDFQLALLRLLFATSNGLATGALEKLSLDRQLLWRWLSALAAKGLVKAYGGGWELTDTGRTAAATGAYQVAAQERRAFYFVDQRPADRPARFLHLTRPALPLAGSVADFSFDPSWLEECIRRPLEWKRQHEFPLDVEAIVRGPVSNELAPLGWRKVILDRPEHLPVAVIQTRVGLLGFQVQLEEWKLHLEKPVFTLTAAWAGVLPDLAEEPAPELWRAAWQNWCRQRSLPPVETDGCPLQQRGYQLEVRASKHLFDRFRATRSDVLQGETWLLAGTGRTRAAACVLVTQGEV
jgi:hypothetical protein